MNPTPPDRFDVAVVGAGVVGCAVVRALTLAGLRTVLLEKSGDILDGASKGNSAILHTGFDAKPGSLEAQLVRRGYELYRGIAGDLGLPFLELGGLVIAWTEVERAKLPAMVEQAHVNGVRDARLISHDTLRDLAPGIGPGALAAVHVPREGIVDPWSAPLAYVLQAIANGAVVHRNSAVTRVVRLGRKGWRLYAGECEIEAEVVVNCAGLYGDQVEALAHPASFRIQPRKGQYIIFDKTARRHVDRIILPVPNDRTKGVVLTPTIFGNVLIGPTAEDQESRDDASVDRDVLMMLEAEAARLVPALGEEPINATYAGIRPATEQSDYQIEASADQRWITVGGIRSTGLTGSLGIAEYVLELYRAHFGNPPPIVEPRRVRVPNLAEHRSRPYQETPGTEIMCHCELVTRMEVERALEGPLPAGTLGGLKRRTRCLMGRCQGFYCSAQIFAMARRHFPIPEEEVQ